MSAPTLYQHFKAMARLMEYGAAPAAIHDQGEATRAAMREARRLHADPERFDYIAARLSSRAIRIARRERAACNE